MLLAPKKRPSLLATKIRVMDSTARYDLPNPISSLYAKMMSLHDPSSKYGFGLRLVEGIVRFLAYVGLADAADAGAGDREMQAWLSRLEHTGTGKLAALARDTARWASEHGRPFMAESTGLWGGEWEKALEEAIELRNRYAHDELALPVTEAAQLLPALEARVAELLVGVQFLRGYYLGLFRDLSHRDQEFRAYWYPCRGLEESGRFEQISSATAPRDEVVMLFDPSFKRGLYLAPFFRWAVSSADGAERLFWLQRLDRGTARYTHPVLRHAPKGASGGEGLPLPAPADWPGRCAPQLSEESRKRLITGAPPLPGQQRYEVIGTIGEGAMGTVYEVLDTRLGQPRALKVLKPELLRFPDARRRLEREAKLLAGLESPNVVRVYDLDLTSDPPFLVMELIRGEDLSARLERTGSIAPSEAAVILEGICRGLAAVHALGAVHRDVKPGNVMLGDRRVYLLDFGIVLPEGGTRYSLSAGRVGTPQYMAPEQWDGEASTASDIFAVGRVLAAMLLGRTPSMRDSPEVGLSSLPAALRAVVIKATSPEPAARYATVEDLALAARAALEREAPVVVGPSPGPVTREPSGPKPREPAPAESQAVATPTVRTPQPSALSPTRLGAARTGPSWAQRRLVLKTTDPAIKAEMEAFGRLWAPTRNLGASLGWKTNLGSRIELYFEHNATSSASMLWVSPSDPERFVFRATAKPGLDVTVERALENAAYRLPCRAHVERRSVKRTGGTIPVVDVVSTYREVIGPGFPDDNEVAARLHAYVGPLLRAVPPLPVVPNAGNAK